MRLKLGSYISSLFFITSGVAIFLGIRVQDTMLVAIGGVVFSGGLLTEMLLMNDDIRELKDAHAQEGKSK